MLLFHGCLPEGFGAALVHIYWLNFVGSGLIMYFQHLLEYPFQTNYTKKFIINYYHFMKFLYLQMLLVILCISIITVYRPNLKIFVILIIFCAVLLAKQRLV